ncbi:MAG: LicD family protein [Candidatus Merdivicinus sp.]|jgi:lipopolysaccharide cholinephosphotransferase
MVSEELTRALQLQGLQIVLLIDSICKKYEIPYYLFYGTELGAIRHGGFIPWDDDVDIVMYRKDFQRFKQVWMQDQPEGYFYQDINTDPNYHVKITKIRKNGTALVEGPVKDIDMHHGIWVDIFPLDDYVQNKFLRHIGELIAMFDYNAVRQYHPGGIRNVLYGVTNVLFRSGKIYRWWFEKVFPHLKKDDTMCSDINSYTLSHRYDFKREWLGKGKRIPFEGEMLPVSENSDATLKVCYGDYWQLPPPEKRISNHQPYFYSVDREYHPGMDIGKGTQHG